MTWADIRAHYAARLHHADLTQHEIAVRGALSGQNAVSKLLANTKRGPSVETFVRAVQGLGVPLSEFFAALEHDEAASVPLSQGSSNALPQVPSPPDEAQIIAIVHDFFARLIAASIDMQSCGRPRSARAMGAPINAGQHRADPRSAGRPADPR